MREEVVMTARWTDRRGLLQAEEGICRAALEHGFNNIVPYVVTKTSYGCWGDEGEDEEKGRDIPSAWAERTGRG
jgi:hypothetical protein